MLAQANRASLAELRAFQEKVRLEDEIAAEAVGEAARAHVEAVLEKGIEATKKRTRVRDYSDVVKVPHSLHCPSVCLLRQLRGPDTTGSSQLVSLTAISNAGLQGALV